MYKLLKYNLFSPKFLSMVTLFAFVLSTATGMTAFAGSPPSPGDMTDYNNCQDRLNQKHSDGSHFFTNAEIKSWGLDRANVRSASLDKYGVLKSKAIQRTGEYEKLLAPDSKLQKIINTVEGVKTQLAAKGATIDPQYNYTIANITPARFTTQASIADMNAKYNNAKTIINASTTALNSSSSSRGQLVNAGCRAVFHAEVYRGVYPVVKAEYVYASLDKLSARNAVRHAMLNGILSIDGAKRSLSHNYSAGTDISKDISYYAESDKIPGHVSAESVSAEMQTTARDVPSTKLLDSTQIHDPKASLVRQLIGLGADVDRDRGALANLLTRVIEQ